MSIRRTLMITALVLCPTMAQACCLFGGSCLFGCGRKSHCGYGPAPHQCGYGGHGSGSWLGLSMGLGLTHCGLGCCNPCPTPCVSNPCPTPCPAPCGPAFETTLCPQFETVYQPQQVTVCRDIPQIECRREAYTEVVPVTVYQQQVRYRDVAYQTTRRVAETHTQYVPHQTVRYVPQTRQIGFQMGATPGCADCTSAGFPPTGTLPPHMMSTPQYTSPYSPTAPTIVDPQGAPGAGLIPQPQDPIASQPWQTIPQRQATGGAAIQQMGWTQPVYSPTPHLPPAPSAASVYRSRLFR